MIQVSGVEKCEGKPDHMWFAYAAGPASAEHLERLFRMAGYEKIRTRDLENA